ncbi:MAG: recombinase family protein [Armatimonadetes bacterium]|nr:recombinase family protein [Armatimonadota bacterium]
MRAALYLRVSTQPQAEKWSMLAQERALIEHCQRQGWDYKVFSDPGISGETLDQRPGIQQLLKEVAAGGYGMVLSVELERFSRSQSLFDWLTLKQVFREAGVKFGTPGQLYDPADVEDDFLSDLFGSLSKREKAKLLVRTRRGKLEAARQGRYLTAIAPFGYVLRDGQLITCEEEAKIVRYIFTLAKEGRGVREIARMLTREGIPTVRQMRGDRRAGTRWAKSSVFRILSNPLYSGEGHWNRRRREGSKHVWRPESEWVAVKVPAIVPSDMWKFMQRRLRENAAFAQRNQKRVYLLKGVLHCAECGGRVYGVPFHGVRYYRCANRPACKSHSVRAAEVESLVWGEVVRAVRQPQLVAEEARRQREDQFSALDELRFKLDSVRNTLRSLPQERERALDAYQHGWTDQVETQRRIEEVRQRQATLEDQARSLEARLFSLLATDDESATVETLLSRFGRRLAGLNDEEKALVVRGLVKAVTIRANGDVEIEGFVRQSGVALVPDGVATGTPNSQTPTETRGGDDPQENVHTMRTLWPPDAAISRARRACAWPFTSMKSTSYCGATS